jgi:hypothetical protein
MRLALILLASCVMYAQTGKPGVTDPIKDPQQIPGRANPGPIPRSTPQPRPAPKVDDQNRTGKTTEKKGKKPAKPKVSQSKPSASP